MSRPTADQIEKAHGHGEKLWQRCVEHWGVVDTYYRREYEVWAKNKKQRNRPAYRPSRPTNIVDHAVNSLIAYVPKVTVYPAKPGIEVHETRSDLKERFLTAVFEETALTSTVLTWKQLGKHLIMYGYAVLEGPTLDLLSRPQKPKDATDEELEIYALERRNWNPYRIEIPHPARVKMDPREKQPSLVTKRYRQYASVLEELTDRKFRQGKTEHIWNAQDDPYEFIDVTEFWDGDWHAMIADGVGLLFVERNTYGFVPFAHAFAGDGMEVTDLAEFDPVYYAKGILDSLIDPGEPKSIGSLLAEAQEASARHNAVVNRLFARLMSPGDPAALAEALEEDGIIPTVETEWLEYPQITADAFQSAQNIGQDIEDGTYARIISGSENTGTVGEQAIRSSQAMRKFDAPTKQLEQIATITGSRVFQLLDRVEDLDGELTIQGHQLGKEDLDHNYACKVTFEQSDPVIQMQLRELGMAEVAGLIKSKETYRQLDLRLPDETGERKRLAKERLRDHPWYIAKEMELAAREEGNDALAEQFKLEADTIRSQLLTGGNPSLAADEMGPQGGSQEMEGPGLAMAEMGAPTARPTPPGTPGAARDGLNSARRQLRKPLTAAVAKPAPRSR